MPRGPKGEKRPADVIGAAVMVGRITDAARARSAQSPAPGFGEISMFSPRSH